MLITFKLGQNTVKWWTWMMYCGKGKTNNLPLTLPTMHWIGHIIINLWHWIAEHNWWLFIFSYNYGDFCDFSFLCHALPIFKSYKKWKDTNYVETFAQISFTVTLSVASTNMKICENIHFEGRLNVTNLKTYEFKNKQNSSIWTWHEKCIAQKLPLSITIHVLYHFLCWIDFICTLKVTSYKSFFKK